MNSAVATNVGGKVARLTGVPLVSSLPTPGVIRLSPTGYVEANAFSVEVRIGWRNAEAVFVPGTFALPLIRKLGEAPVESRIAFTALADIARRHARLTLRINQADADPADDKSWSQRWEAFELSLRKHGLILEELPPAVAAETLASLAAPIIGMVAALIGIEDVEVDESALEGNATEQLSRKYERRAVNREICLALMGRRCWCCGFDFGARYGASADGFIEVHHRVPLSEMGPSYLVHPTRDLFPVCSNCHSVIHLSTPPEDPDELRTRLHAVQEK